MKTKVLCIVIVISCGLLNNSIAQTVIEGKIITRSDKSIPDASVMLMNTADSSVVAFSFSNGNGEYIISSDQKEDELLIMVYSFNIERVIKKIHNKSQKVDFVVNEEAIELKEFSVKSEKIWGTGDTVNYIVDAFRDTTDVVIGDVLKKMPGIEVKESGQIEYRGKPISKFYIENMDMLQGRYGIATNNISATNIATVQVFENHQPIKALQDLEFTDDAAINLKLKQGAKGVFNLMASLGTGVSDQFLWNNGLTGMYFGKTKQYLVAYKTNNAGEELSKELQSFTGNNPLTGTALSSMVMPSAPPVSKSRYYFNYAHGATINTLKKWKNDNEFTFNLIGLQDMDERSSFSRTTFIFPESDTLSVNEELSSETKNNKIEGEVGYLKNVKENYLRTRLKFSGTWKESTGTVNGDAYFDQAYDDEILDLAHSLHWIRRKQDESSRGTEFNSRTWFRSRPYHLTVSPGVFTGILNDSLPYQAVKQNVGMNMFETRNSLMFLSSVVWKSVFIQPVFRFSLQHQSLKSHFSKAQTNNPFVKLPGDSLSNNQQWLNSKTGFSLIIKYIKNNLSFKLSSPLQFQYISLTDDNKTINPEKQKFLFQPSAELLYDINNKWDISGKWFYYNNIPDLRTLYSGYIVRNYRTLNRYDNKLTDSYGNRASLKLSYKDVMQFLFTSLEVSYNQYHNEVMYAQEFEGATLKTTLLEMNNKGDYLSVKGRASKGFNWKKLSLSFEGAFGKGNTPQLRQGKLIEYVNQGLNANFTTSLAITGAVLLANKCSYSQVKGETKPGEVLNPIRSFIDAATLDIVLPVGLILNTAVEYYNTHDGNHRQQFYLLDAGMAYTWKKIRLSLDWQNLLNTKNYVYAYYGSLNSYYSKYTIRPSSILLKARFKLY